MQVLIVGRGKWIEWKKLYTCKDYIDEFTDKLEIMITDSLSGTSVYMN